MKEENLRVLIGWKEIASYLSCSISSASRRVADGLPVFRVGGGIRAFADDIDRWLEGERLRKLDERSPGALDLPGVVVDEENLLDTVTAIRREKKGHRYAVIPLGVDTSEYERIESRLASAEEKYRWVLETVPVWIWETDAAGEYSYSNVAVAGILGYRPEELTGFRPDEFLLAPEEVEKCHRAMEGLRAEKKVVHDLRCRYIHRDETERWLETDAEPIFDAAGDFAGIRGVSRDVTERKRAEEKEREHLRILSFLSATAMEFVEYPLDKDLFPHIAEKLNDLAGEAIVTVASYDEATDRFQLKAITGLDGKADVVVELLGKDPLGLTFPTSAKVKGYLLSGKLHKTPANLPVLTGGEISRRIGRKLQTKLGLGDVHIMGITKYGELLGAVGIITPPGEKLADADVVEAFVNQASVAVQRRKAEDALLRAAEEWRRTFDAVPDIILFVGRDYKVVRANRAAAQRVGGRWEDVVGQKCCRVFHGREEPLADCPLPGLFTTGEEQGHKEVYSTALGAYFDFNFAPVKGNGSAAAGAVMVGRDVTDKVRAEKLTRAQRDLAQALGTSVDLSEAARLCVQAAIAVSGLDAGGLYVVDERTGALDLVCAEGLPAPFVKSASHFEATSPNARLVKAGDPVYSKHANLGVPIAGPRRRERLRAIAVLPVKFRGEIVACLNVASRTQDDVSPWARHALEGIAAQIGGVVARIKAEEALRESEREFRVLFENARDAIFWADPETGLILRCNRAAEALAAKPETEIVGQHYSTLHPQEEAAYYRELFNRYVEAEGPVEAEARVLTPSGDIRDVLISASSTTVGGNTIVQGIFHDVTERKRAEESLRESHDYLDRILNGMYEGVVVLSRDYTIQDANRCFIGQYAENGTGLLGRHCYEVTHRRSAPCAGSEHPCPLDAVFATGEPSRAEHLHRDRDGNEVIVEIYAFPLLNADGDVESVVEICNDVTERRRTEEALQESEGRFRSVVEQTPFSTAICAPDGTLLVANEAFMAIWGVPTEAEESFLGSFNLLTDEQIRAAGIGPYVERGFGGEVTVLPPHLYTLKGTPGETGWEEKEVWVRGCLYPVKHAAGEVQEVVAMLEDVTERIRAEEAVRESQRELQNLFDTLAASESKYRALFEKSPVSVALVDTAGVLVDLNRATEELIGYRNEEIVGKRFEELVVLEAGDLPSLRDRFARLLRGEEVGPYELEIVRRDGTKRRVEVVSTPFERDGNVDGIQVISRDLTARDDGLSE